jgi:hypothetical protein
MVHLKDRPQLAVETGVTQEFRELGGQGSLEGLWEEVFERASHLIICHMKGLMVHVPIRRGWTGNAGEDMKMPHRGLKPAALERERQALPIKGPAMAAEPARVLAAGQAQRVMFKTVCWAQTLMSFQKVPCVDVRKNKRMEETENAQLGESTRA